MKRTDKMVCVGKRSGYDVYRVVFQTEDGHYIVKWNNRVVNVDDDMTNRNYTYANPKFGCR